MSNSEDGQIGSADSLRVWIDRRIEGECSVIACRNKQVGDVVEVACVCGGSVESLTHQHLSSTRIR